MSKQKVLILTDGTQLPVTDEAGKYYTCEGGMQFRKLSTSIARVEEAEVQEPEPAKKKEPKPKVKTTAKKKETTGNE